MLLQYANQNFRVPIAKSHDNPRHGHIVREPHPTVTSGGMPRPPEQ
jgi:hypothetical protein